MAHEHGAWVHVDGAFGLWAAASPELRHLTRGIEQADSWGCDAHKWLNVPYDSGLVFVSRPDVHAAATSIRRRLPDRSGEGTLGGSDLVLGSSRRARGFAVWAAIRELGRSGIAELVERNCALARRFADQLGEAGAEIANEVVLNQVLVGFGDDATTDAVIDRVQRDGTCWMGGTTWRGRTVHAHLGVEPHHHGGRRRPLRRGDPALLAPVIGAVVRRLEAMTFPWLKGHGTENDFVLLPDHDGTIHGAARRRLRGRPLRPSARYRRRRCHARHPHVGASVEDSAGEWFMDYRNHDGSLSEMCGNGIRVFAKHLIEEGLVDAGAPIVIGTRDGDKTITDDGRRHVQRRHGRRRGARHVQGHRGRADLGGAGRPHRQPARRRVRRQPHRPRPAPRRT